MNEPTDDCRTPDGVIEEGDRVEAKPIVSPASIDEQLARFEDALKEEDWGHQPC